MNLTAMSTTEVKAIEIRGQLHAINCNVMTGFKTLCGKRASFGHSVTRAEPDKLDCPTCRAAIERRTKR